MDSIKNEDRTLISAYTEAVRFIANPSKYKVLDPRTLFALEHTWGNKRSLNQANISSFTLFSHFYLVAQGLDALT
ncbi:hypothetical protein Psal006b_02944 [Piscirickettsia salmonis]|uniref:2-hydroxy-6-oxohepta-2,4-dienoate hydrolase n=1 Tax=Piscirickettsia salmonis TaxID=1238 RepID=A0A1L6TGH7_PISSA|nr:hypothetical protein [Piscirickettsia salmonis]ALB21462.1 2-hydroxy-6-oxohepta-2,4-dienoate hydrolase [Piscirickettsia salmonis]ALT18091.1 hypothetical protein PSLF89_03765 [Piscirickettsia salmonis LF-89 = ATCC VR-1361]ALY01686.1 hypothetical protein AWE47_01385 [Piscirickettsia salmonis]AMA41202.1 hypothetical protein AWJ11_01395 [Piscirickettsia salmonis]AOS36391.1 hypothetical protein AVM72_14380 [Piscirickettsia salmonis]